MIEEYAIPMSRSLAYLLEAFVLLWVAKFAYTAVYRRVELKAELFQRNNHALAVSVSGYLFGVILAFGGALSGPSTGWQSDAVGIAAHGLVAIVLMLIASFLCEKILLPHFDNTEEVVRDHNLGAAFVEAGMHVANGLIILAIIQGSGVWWIGLVFWALAQVGLIVVGRLYEAVTPHEIHEELRKNNAAVGLAFGGALVGMGNIISVAVAGDFLGWRSSLTSFAAYALFGLVVLFVLKRLTDSLLAPGVKLASEQTEQQPNIGAGLLEAFGYVGGSMLLIWVL
jgi:uncharacterized membrane protein YjfL (UPF0719 family)